MRMELLLFADTRHAVPAFRENAPEWAFFSVAKKRKGVEKRGPLGQSATFGNEGETRPP